MEELKKYKVKRVSRSEIKNFIEQNHYSKNINGCIADYCYALYDGLEMKGAMFFGRMAMAGQWKRFSDQPDNVIELRRLCCVDNTPKNTESFFISKALKQLKIDWQDGLVVSYADAEFGHTGVIYKASNFIELEFKKGAKVIKHENGKTFHDKTIRTKYKGKLKPFAQKLLQDLENKKAWYQKTKGKYTYIYPLNKKDRKKWLAKVDI